MSQAWKMFKRDAARWQVPEQLGDPDKIGVLQAVLLLRRYRPLRAIAWFRLGSWGRDRGIRGMAWFAGEQIQRKYGLDLPVSTDIGAGFYLAHPSGVSITADRIGENASLVGALTIGINGMGNAPTIGDNVYIGAGARVIGSITVGHNVKVGANSVVVGDVEDGLTVVGAPAKPTRASLEASTQAALPPTGSNPGESIEGQTH